MQGFKTCSKCGETLPATTEYFYKQKDGKYGLRGDCIKCRSIQDKSYREKHTNESKIYGKQYREYWRQYYQIYNPYNENETKSCTRCGKTYPKTEEFWHRDNNPSGLSYNCIGCVRNRNREEKLRKLYDITKEEYDKMFEEQNGCCAICGKEETMLVCSQIAWLSVDHDHKTGEVRRLLCSKCNTGLGCFDDNVDLLKKAIDYLRSNGEENLMTIESFINTYCLDF